MMKQSEILLSGKKILLVMIGISITLFADFSRSSVGVVADSVTGLQWQDDYSDNNDTIKSTNWKEAIKYCNELILNNGEWRLPNKNELLSIVDYTKTDPAINNSENGFQNTTSNYYWSSTTYANATSAVWNVNFSGGSSITGYKTGNYYVRCVKSEQSQTEALVANAGTDQTITLGEILRLDGSSSASNDDIIMDYVWSENGSTIANCHGQEICQYDSSGFAVGDHIIKLTVYDNNGKSASDTVKITILQDLVE